MNRNTTPSSGEKTWREHASHWLQDPLRSVVVASATCMSSLGIVLGGSWFISMTLS
ncbi:MAG: hypothetical protein AB8C02_04880 [Halioglobus sp.]